MRNKFQVFNHRIIVYQYIFLFFYVKKLPIAPKIAPKMALNDNAESAIIVTCEIIINNRAFEIITVLLLVAEN